MTTTTTVSECFLAIGKKNASKLFLRQVDANNITSSTSTRVVVIVVHGGPGLSDHSESFAGLHHLRGASTVLFFDQLGCGKSVVDDTEDAALYTTLKGHVEQLQHVIEYCQKQFDDDDTKLCVLGHSWGGQVLLELLFSSSSSSTTTTSAGIHAAIISNTPLDEHHYQEHQRRLRASLEDDSIRDYYEEQDAQTANDKTVGAQIYHTLIGTSDTNITGEMKDWSALSRLSVYLRNANTTPCLFVSTKDDTIPHEDYQLIVQQQELPIKAAAEDDSSASSLLLHHQVVIMKQGGHGPFFGATAAEYFNIIEQFWKNAIHGGTSTNGRVTSVDEL
jgi:pimeloyl-ACP methyl ester carboxylesterase